eukprot:Lankesteria_metandrocarpae@DN3894_c1_g1_i1.p1
MKKFAFLIWFSLRVCTGQHTGVSYFTRKQFYERYRGLDAINVIRCSLQAHADQLLKLSSKVIECYERHYLEQLKLLLLQEDVLRNSTVAQGSLEHGALQWQTEELAKLEVFFRNKLGDNCYEQQCTPLGLSFEVQIFCHRTVGMQLKKLRRTLQSLGKRAQVVTNSELLKHAEQ